MIGIVNYGLGNLYSLEKALRRLKIQYIVSSNPNELESCSKFILSGVGHFEYGMTMLKNYNLDKFIISKIAEGNKFLGICLGMQILSRSSQEGNILGLNIIPEDVVKLEVEKPFKIPHIGWNTIQLNGDSKLLAGISEDSVFYFTHSYAYTNYKGEIFGVTSYGNQKFISLIEHNNVYGVQFHPEKSFDQGLMLINNFCSL